LSQVLHEQNIDAVIHFAGLKAVAESVTEPMRYYHNNVFGSLCLLQAMQQAGVKRLVFSSSATVYGEPQYLPIDEAHPTAPTNPYGWNKLHIEQMLADLSAADSDWRIASLRYFNPVGAHESGLIGEDPNGIPNNLMPYIARVAAGQLPQVNVFGNDYPTPDGTGIRDYIHVMDLAEGHLAALVYLNQASQAFNVFNLGTGQGLSVLELLQHFELATGKAIASQLAPRRPGDVASVYAKAEKSKALLNWYAKKTVEQACADAWAFQNSNLHINAGQDLAR
jgi:UDP-glucose 4-epimerase